MKSKLAVLMVLAAVLALFVLPGTALADSTSGFGYTLDEGNATITEYWGAGGAVTIPSTIDGYPVTGISNAFVYTKVTSVSIPASVTEINEGSFSFCYFLTDITVDPANPKYTSEGGVLFSKNKTELVSYPAGKRETDYTAPGGVKTIAYMAFAGAGVNSVSLPAGVTNIGIQAFGGSELKHISMPASVADIGGGAFGDCYGLEDITVDPANTVYSSQDGVLFDCAKTKLMVYPAGNTRESYAIPGTVTKIEYLAFNYASFLKSVSIPGSVKAIDDSAFCLSGLTAVDIPAGVETIGNYAFGSTTLKTVTIPDTVSSIGDDAFLYCFELTDITVNDANAAYSSGGGVLFNKDKTKLLKYPAGKTDEVYVVPASVTEIFDNAFESTTALKGVTLPAALKTIGDYAFSGTGLASVSIPAGVGAIGDSAFMNCPGIADITVDAANTAYLSQDGVLFDISKKDLILYPASSTRTDYRVPGGVEKIYPVAFRYAGNLKNVALPISLTSIGNSAFQGSGLTGVTIPANVSDIRPYTFYGCLDLEYINVDAANPDYRSADGVLMDGTTLVQYPSASTRTDYTVPADITALGEGAFTACKNLKTLTIPAKMEMLDDAIDSCTALTAINVDSGNLYYASEAGVLFDKAKTELMIYPSSKADAAYTIPQGVGGIYERAFFSCPNLESVTIPASVRFMEGNVFGMCPNLSSVVFQGNAPIASNGAFIDCAPGFKILYPIGWTGWTSPQWKGSPAEAYGYKVTFNSQGGSAVKDGMAYKTAVAEPKAPSRDGYIFAGWFKEASCASAWNFSSEIVNGDVTLYAKWTPVKYSIQYDLNGGNAANPVSYTVESASFTLNNPTRYGYDFTGWSGTGISGTTMSVTVPAGSTGDRSYKAHWSVQPQTFYLAGVGLSSGSLDKQFSKSVYSYKVTIGENDLSFTLTPRKEFDGATMTVNKKPQSSWTVNLANGKSAKISVKVAFGKKSKTYTFTVTRAKSTNNALSSLTAAAGTWSQPFDPNVLNYTLTLDESTKSTSIKAAAASGKLAKVSPASKKITLNNGQSKTVKITVKAQSGAKKVYTITVVRAVSTNAGLKSLKCDGLTPKFNTGTTAYTVTLPANKSSVSISAKAAGYKAVVSIDGLKKSSKKVTLANGQTVTVRVTVTAQAGNTKEYVITVTRQ